MRLTHAIQQYNDLLDEYGDFEVVNMFGGDPTEVEPIQEIRVDSQHERVLNVSDR